MKRTIRAVPEPISGPLAGIARIAAGLAAAGLVIAPPLHGAVRAQEAGGLLVTLGVSSGLQYEINDGDEEDQTGLVSRLSFGLSSVTRSQRLELGAVGLLDLSDPSAEDPVRPSASLAYGYETRDFAFAADLDYSVRDIDALFLDPAFEPALDGDLDFDSADLIAETGSRADTSLGFVLETGRTAPFGTVTTLRLRERDYSDVTDPDLSDQTSASLGTVLRFSVTPTVDLRLIASRFESDEDDLEQTDRERTRLAVGVTAPLDRVWTLSAELGRTRVLTTETLVPGGPRVEDEVDGTDFALSASRALANGSLGLSFGRTFNENGARDTFQVSRALALASGGTFSGSLGVTAFEGGSTSPVVTLALVQPLPQGTLAANLTQQGDVTDDGDNVVRTTGGASFLYPINPVSSLSLSGQLAAVDVLSGVEDSTLRAEVGLNYNRSLTEDWGLTAGIRHRVTYDDGDRADSSSILSLNVARSFAFRP